MTPHLGDLVGRPFAFGGQTSNGIGCYGTAREVLRRFGIPLIEVNTSDFNGAHSQVMDFMKNPRGVPPVIRKKTNGKILRVSELASEVVSAYVRGSLSWIEVEKPEGAVLGIFKVRILHMRVAHLGVFLDEENFIHGVPPCVRVERLTNSRWAKRLVSMHKYVGERMS